MVDQKTEILMRTCISDVIGACTALEKFVEAKPLIDVERPLDVYLATLVVTRIVGSRLWCLWKDVCSEDPVQFAAVVIAMRHGVVPVQDVLQACDRTRYEQGDDPDRPFKHDLYVDAVDCVKKVREFLDEHYAAVEEK